MVSGVSVLGCIWGGVWRKMVVACLFFAKNVRDVFSILVYLSFIWILLFKTFIVGMYLVINGFPMIL